MHKPQGIRATAKAYIMSSFLFLIATYMVAAHALIQHDAVVAIY